MLFMTLVIVLSGEFVGAALGFIASAICARLGWYAPGFIAMGAMAGAVAGWFTRSITVTGYEGSVP